MPPCLTHPTGTHGARAAEQVIGSANVEVFLTSWCGYCKKMVQF